MSLLQVGTVVFCLVLFLKFLASTFAFSPRVGGSVSRNGPSVGGSGSRNGPRAGGSVGRNGPSVGGSGSRNGPSVGGSGSWNGPRVGGSGSRNGPRVGGSVSRNGPSVGGSVSRNGPSVGGSVSRNGPEAFVVHTDFDYIIEANRFTENRYFYSELGNTMPLATALQFSIVIFSKDPNTPTMYITPEVITTEATAFLIYTPSGQGHYDAAIACHNLSTQTSPDHLKPASCSFGTGNKTLTNASCKPSPFYRTRCNCYKGSRSCSALCLCINCASPCGSRPPPSQGQKRTRRKHELQTVIPSSKRLRGECISEDIWSTFESIVIYEICASHHEETDKNIIASCITTLFITLLHHFVLFHYRKILCSAIKTYPRSPARSTTLRLVLFLNHK